MVIVPGDQHRWQTTERVSDCIHQNPSIVSLVGRSLEDESESWPFKRDGMLEVDGLFDSRTNSLR